MLNRRTSTKKPPQTVVVSFEGKGKGKGKGKVKGKNIISYSPLLLCRREPLGEEKQTTMMMMMVMTNLHTKHHGSFIGKKRRIQDKINGCY